MKKDPSIFLHHIMESISLIETYLQGVTEKQFHTSTEKQDLVVRRLEIIGEAAKNLPPEFKKKHPYIPWKDMAGMRDIIAHKYFGINFNTVWDTVQNLLPTLKIQIVELSKKV